MYACSPFEDQSYEVSVDKRRELLQLGRPDDGYDYTRHLKELAAPRQQAQGEAGPSAPLATAENGAHTPTGLLAWAPSACQQHVMYMQCLGLLPSYLPSSKPPLKIGGWWMPEG
jgi:hypothetical protein